MPLPLAGQTALSTGIPISYPRTSLSGHSGSVPKISFFPDRLKEGKRKGPTEHKEKETENSTASPQNKRKKAKPLLLHPLHLRLGSPLDLQLAFLPDGWGRSTRSLLTLPPWWGLWPPPPRSVLSDPPGRAGISPCAVGTSTVRALCRHIVDTCGLSPHDSPQPSFGGPS